MQKNVIAPDGGTIDGAAAVVIEAGAWDYASSVERVSLIFGKWKGVTLELARELYFAREALTGQKGQYKNPDAEDYIFHTWSGYCEAVGVPLSTANNWVKSFVPAALSADKEDKLLTAKDLKAVAPPPALTGSEQERRIAQVMNGGGRPDNWSREEERIVKERQSRRRVEELTRLWVEGKFDLAPRQDYFKKILAKTKTAKKFQLKSKEQAGAQFTMFDAVDGYLKMFPDKESVLAAAANLTARIHDVVNYLVEQEIIRGRDPEPEE